MKSSYNSLPKSTILKLMLTLFLAVLQSRSGLTADRIPYGTASWPHILGNHRAVVEVAEKGEAVFVKIPWRRPDINPQEKGIVITNLKTGKKIKNFGIVNQNREFCELVFQPDAAPEKYAVYYFPLKLIKGRRTGSTDYKYAAPVNFADRRWLESQGLGESRYLEANTFERLPKAKVVKFEARSEFDSFYPMEVIATQNEIESLLEYNEEEFLLFTEDSQHPIKMFNDIPLRWAESGPKKYLSAKVMRNEIFAFQIGVFAAADDLTNLSVKFESLTSKNGSTISPEKFNGINLSGSDALGRAFNKKLSVKKGKVQPLWITVKIDEDLPEGSYEGSLKVMADDCEEQSVDLSFSVQPEKLDDRGVGDLWRMSRLAWLNSNIGLDSSTVTKPYSPLTVEGHTINAKGKTVTLSSTGLPQSLKADDTEILAAPIKFRLALGKKALGVKSSGLEFKEKSSAVVSWQNTTESRELTVETNARLDFDGYSFYSIKLKAHKNIEIKEAALEIPYRREIATYMMGLDTGTGGYRKEKVSWKWQDRPNNKAWIGDVKAGLRCKLRGNAELEHIWAEYRPEVNGIPESWSNGGAGGCDVYEVPDGPVMLRAYSGGRNLKAGEELEFNFSLMITPVRPRNPEHWYDPKGWQYRFSMMGCSPKTNRALGAMSATAFHASPMNPYINYPFLADEKLAEWAKGIHALGMKAGLYYKIGELSNHCPELWALRSLGDEVIQKGNDGGGEWLQEHVRNNYQPKWHCTPKGIEQPADASLATTGFSRWNNYYAESIGWLVKRHDLDELYYDGIMGYSRQMLMRVRRIVDAVKPGFLLDFHSGNTITRRSNAYNDVMEHLPFFDCTWIGEGFNYDGSPDFYMVELSGIPFGVPNAMLQYGGNQWRGMLYGMSNRYIENMPASPTSMWEFWDRAEIQNSRMIGYWDENSPVSTGNKDVLATVYKFSDKALIAVASWAKERTSFRLKADWKALDLDSKNIIAYAPEIPEFQPETTFDLSKEISIPRGKGWLILLEEKKSLPNIYTFDDKRKKTGVVTSAENSQSWKKVIKPSADAGQIDFIKDGISIKAVKEAAAFIELPVPENSAAFECLFTAPDATGYKYRTFDRVGGMQAPGIAVCWPEGRTLRIYEACHGIFAIDDGIMDHYYTEYSDWAKTKSGTGVSLRIRWDSKHVFAEASINRTDWTIIRSLPREIFKGNPVSVRLGKMSKDYGWPRTVSIGKKGKEQKATYSDIGFWVR